MSGQWYTFLFTDIVGSTRLWEESPEKMDKALAWHDLLLQQNVEACGGQVFKMVGDALHAKFLSPIDSLKAAINCQHALQSGEGVGLQTLSVRMALHSGECLEREGDYFGPTLNRISRLLDAAHGGQMILSQAVVDILGGSLPAGAHLRDLGQHRLKDLGQPERIYQLLFPGLEDAFPPLRTLNYRPHNLPTSTTSFVGRVREIEELRALSKVSRLLTLTGPGGIGKTRLALQAAAELFDDFGDGVFYVALAAVRDPTLVPQAVIEALNAPVSEKEEAEDGLIRHMKAKELLLVLDNFEQVIDAGPFLGKLLTAGPYLHILVTSRQRLDIYGEHEYPVPVLDLPDAESVVDWSLLAANDAVTLFVQRAQAAKLGFTLTPENIQEIASICRNLDGLPLAIELAAPRIRFFSPATLNLKLSSRLGFLTAGPRDAPARQRTLRGAIEWSHDLLDSMEKSLFRRLGIFVSGWTLEAAEEVCTDADSIKDSPEISEAHLSKDQAIRPDNVFELLTSLVDKSLVRLNVTDEGDPRFYMLDTIREYALERLAASNENLLLQRRHLDCYLSIGENEEAQLEQMTPAAVKRLVPEHDNFAAALAWSLTQESPGVNLKDRQLGVRLAIALRMYWYIRGFLSEGRRWLDLALEYAQERANSRASVLYGNGMMAWQQGDYGPSQAALEESAAIYRECNCLPGLADAVHFLGHLAFDQCEYKVAQLFFNESLDLFRSLNDETFSLILLSDTGMVAYHQNDLVTARARFEEALEGFRQQGKDGSAADQLNRLGDLARMDNNYLKAEALYTESLQLFKGFDDTLGIASCLHKLGQVCLHNGNIYEARDLFSESLSLQQEAGNKQGIAECLAACAGLAGLTGKYELGARLGGVTTAYLEELGAPLSPADRSEFKTNLKLLEHSLSSDQYRKMWADGASLNIEEGIALVRRLLSAA